MSASVERFLETLDADELEYAREYADTLAVGAAEPGLGAVTIDRAQQIRAAMTREWTQRVWAPRRRRKEVTEKD
jgi:hypothetical protein